MGKQDGWTTVGIDDPTNACCLIITLFHIFGSTLIAYDGEKWQPVLLDFEAGNDRYYCTGFGGCFTTGDRLIIDIKVHHSSILGYI